MVMARDFNIGDEVAITAIVRGRVTEDRVSVTIPSYSFPYSIVDRTLKAQIGQHIELTGSVIMVDDGKVTVSFGGPRVTVDVNVLGLVASYVRPKRQTPLFDKPT